MARKIQPALFKLIDDKLKSNGAAQKAILDKDARSLLVYAAESCVGEKEQGGNNKGKFVELCLKTVSLSGGNPWCLAYVQSMIAYVEQKLGITSPLFSTGHCLTAWEKTPKNQRVKIFPLAGAIIIWKHGKTQNGHTGFVLETFGKTFLSNEGNTSGKDLSGKVNRDGDGVYINERKFSGNGSMKVVGFLKPF